MTPFDPRRVADARNAQAWLERAQRAAQLVQERTGLPVQPLAPMGGLWAPLEAVETWLGISQPGTPPARHQHEAWQIQESAAGGRFCVACGEPVE